MNRRDTIIIAVLLNAGVLAILFMLAVNDREEEPAQMQFLPPIVRVEHSTTDSNVVAAVKPTAEDFIDFNMDESLSSAADELASPLEEYAFSSQVEVSPPVKTAAPPSAEASKLAADSFVSVTVKRGDSLDKLARNNGTTIEAIKKANNLKSDMLSIGQVLQVPVSAKTPIVKIIEPKKANSDGGNSSYYTIKTGDSPWKIAKQNNLNPDELLRLNNLDEEKARNLKIGDKIRIK